MANGSPGPIAILLLAIYLVYPFILQSYSLRPSCGSFHLYTTKHTDFRGRAVSKQSQHNFTLTFESSKPKCSSFPKRQWEATPVSDRLLYAVYAVHTPVSPPQSMLAVYVYMYWHSWPDLEPLLPVSKHAPKAGGQEGPGMGTQRGPWSCLDDWGIQD